MQGLIFAGGLGTRINKGLKNKKLKPLIKINNQEIILKIIKFYLKHGVKDIILLGGYKFQELDKFAKKQKKLKLKAINTGLYTETGGRLLLASKYINSKNFLLTYGDTIVDFDLSKSIKKKNKNNFVFTLFKHKINYGVFNFKNSRIVNISEKKHEIFINAGFYVLDKRVFKFINSTKDSFEKKIIPQIIKSKIKISYTFTKYWHPIDTLDDKKKIERELN